ncbi:MAG TPA: nucleotidyl transferase AbiEii/AbiGii toxin family protein [Candidatus Angelobacter sp.]|jgi:predicted nucleotidyltransferase component of viral defense system|nr:nucleotidyl transferase AbiEii/AbiGii toxin family protein [Candidatus Angelobacter sp.]
MLTQPQVQRYSNESGLRDIMIAEKEVMLTFLLQLLSERGILNRLAFKGGTCLRKMFIGSQGRFSTDLDFTGIDKHDHEEIVLEMMGAFEQPFHGIQFIIPDDSYYETQDGLSWGVNPTYSHDWNTSSASEVRLQISRRETPTLPTESRPQIEQSYFKLLPFAPTDIICLALPEIIAEKIRACYQRNKARDICDLGMFALRPLDRALIRRLVVLKLWQARDTFDPARLMQKFQDGKDFDWDDLRDLLNRAVVIDRDRITGDCVRGFGFLAELTPDEQVLANDQYQREKVLWERLSEDSRLTKF